MDKPQILYKSRNICDNTEKILSEQKVWLSKPENLNDPFECSIANYSEKVKEQLTKMFKSVKVAMFCIQCKRSIDNGNSLFGLKRKALKVLLKKMATIHHYINYKCFNNKLVYKDNVEIKYNTIDNHNMALIKREDFNK